MGTNSPETNLANFKRVLLIWAGAAVTLFAVAVADLPNNHSPCFPGWWGVWIVLQAGTITPAIMLLFGPGFRKLPFPERMNTLFAYLAVSWVAILGCAVNSSMFFTMHAPTYFGFPNGMGIAVSLTQLYLITGVTGAGIGITYWILHQKFIASPEVMFP